MENKKSSNFANDSDLLSGFFSVQGQSADNLVE